MASSKSKSRWRFSLRSLFIVLTFICVGFAMLTHPLVESRKQQRVIAQLEKIGANISSRGSVTREFSIGRTILGYFDSEFIFDSQYIVDFGGSSIRDQDLALLEELPYLFHLDVSDTKVTDAGLGLIAACSNLRELDLTNTQVTDTGILKLKSLPILAWLKTTGTAVSYPALSELDSRLPWANFAEQRAIAEVQAFGGQAPAIRRILDVPNYPDGFVKSGETLMGGHLILGMNRRLNLTRTDISHLAYLESVTKLHIHDVIIEPGSFADVLKLPKLTKLKIYHTDISDLDMKHLTRQLQLETFTLYNNKLVTDVGISELAKLKSLKTIEVGACEKVTPDSVEDLRLRLPDCKITHSKW